MFAGRIFPPTIGLPSSTPPVRFFQLVPRPRSAFQRQQKTPPRSLAWEGFGCLSAPWRARVNPRPAEPLVKWSDVDRSFQFPTELQTRRTDEFPRPREAGGWYRGGEAGGVCHGSTYVSDVGYDRQSEK